jgi:hypothetical protein
VGVAEVTPDQLLVFGFIVGLFFPILALVFAGAALIEGHAGIAVLLLVWYVLWA